MNEEIKRKLSDLEINPPARTWDKISAALDEEVTAEFPSQLYELELNPPAKIWDSVATTLSYSEKLYNIELTPPVSVWERITSTLDEGKKEPKVVPIRRFHIWKYAAAASLLAFLAFGVKWLTAERTGTHMAIESKPAKKSEDTQKSVSPSNTETITAIKSEKEDPSPVKQTNNLPNEGPRELIATTNTTKNVSRRAGNYIQTAAYQRAKTEFASPDEFCLTNLQTNSPGNQPKFSDAAYRYLVFENDNCELIRISKKLAEKLGCNVPDPFTPEYQHCIQQLKKWSEKIAQMNLNPSADNFMNIVELLKSTEEKQF